MKILCYHCGCHFKEDFEKSLKCGFWEARRLQSLPKEFKKRVWDCLFTLPQDEIAVKTGIALIVNLSGGKYEGNVFVKEVPGYNNWPDSKRRQFQREYFKFTLGLSDKEKSNLILKAFLHINKKWTKK